MERYNFTTTIASLLIVPIIMLMLCPAPRIKAKSCTDMETICRFEENGKTNRYIVNYEDRTVTAYLDDDNSIKVPAIKQKVTPSQILRIKKAIDERDKKGDPVRPILEGRHYSPV